MTAAQLGAMCVRNAGLKTIPVRTVSSAKIATVGDLNPSRVNGAKNPPILWTRKKVIWKIMH